MNTKDKVESTKLYLRDVPGMTASEFIRRYTRVFSEYAYATRDEGFNEFEKEINHVLGMLIYHMKFCEIIGLKDGDGGPFDPRDIVNAYDKAHAPI